MLTPKEQWCHRCERYAATDIKHKRVGKTGKLAKIVVTSRKGIGNLRRKDQQIPDTNGLKIPWRIKTDNPPNPNRDSIFSS